MVMEQNCVGERFFLWAGVKHHTLLVIHREKAKIRSMGSTFKKNPLGPLTHAAGFKNIPSATKEQHNTQLFPLLHM